MCVFGVLVRRECEWFYVVNGFKCVECTGMRAYVCAHVLVCVCMSIHVCVSMTDGVTLLHTSHIWSLESQHHPSILLFTLHGVHYASLVYAQCLFTAGVQGVVGAYSSWRWTQFLGVPPIPLEGYDNGTETRLVLRKLCVCPTQCWIMLMIGCG